MLTEVEVIQGYLDSTKIKYYGGGNELKVGDKIYWGYTTTYDSNSITMNFTSFTSKGGMLYQLYKKD